LTYLAALHKSEQSLVPSTGPQRNACGPRPLLAQATSIISGGKSSMGLLQSRHNRAKGFAEWDSAIVLFTVDLGLLAFFRSISMRLAGPAVGPSVIPKRTPKFLTYDKLPCSVTEPHFTSGDSNYGKLVRGSNWNRVAPVVIVERSYVSALCP
jgi:hypothetical protein